MNARRLFAWFDPEVRRLREDAALNAAELARTCRALTIAIGERAAAQREYATLLAERDQGRRDLADEEELHARVRHQRDIVIGERDDARAELRAVKAQRDAAFARLRELGETSIDLGAVDDA